MNNLDKFIESSKADGYTLQTLEDNILDYDDKIKNLIKFLQNLKLNKKIGIKHIKENILSLNSIKEDLNFLEDKLEKIYELYTLCLEEEIDKIKKL